MSTDAMAMVWTVGVGLVAREHSSSKQLLWNMAASASRQILLIMETASTGYLPGGGGGAVIEISLHKVTTDSNRKYMVCEDHSLQCNITGLHKP